MFYLLLVIILNANILITYCDDHETSRSFLGSAEQVHRKSRVSRDFLQINNAKNVDHDDDVLNIDTKTTAEADTTIIITPTEPTNTFDLTKDGIENYKNYFEADPKNLTEQQKTLLERIVDRAARFGGFNNSELNDDKFHENEGRASSNQNKQASNKNKVKSTVTTRRPLSATKATTKRISSQTASGTASILRTTSKPSTTSTFTKATLNTEAQIKTTGSNQKYIETSNKPHNLSRNNATIKNPVSAGGNNVAAASTIATSSFALNENKQSSDINIDLNTMKKTNDIIYPDNVTTASLIDSLSRDHAGENFYVRERPQSDNNKNKKNPQTGTVKPTKYHYYPHNQHIYLLPECAIQQVCNAVYVRLNYTQPLCACPSRYRDPCSASLNEDDLHTTKLIGDENRKAITLAKTCETTTEMRECRSPKDWSILALQNTRTGKSHYLVICRCPDSFKLEGPMAHDQPTYASVPGIRVFGMMCVKPGVPIRRPSVQPPKRFQQTKPFYTQPSSSIVYTEATLPQRPASYQYLGRPGSPTSTATSYLDKIPLSTFASSNYGRENLSNRRTKRTIDDDDDIPEIPWDRVKELKDSIYWN